MATIIIGKSLRIVRNRGKNATDQPGRKAGQTVIGKPVNVVGTTGTMQKYTGIAPDLYAAIVNEPDPKKRSALLTNVTGTVLDGTRSAIRRDVFAAFVAEHLAAVAADPDAPTDDEREAARVRVQSFLTAGLVAFPNAADGEDEDALSWAFGIADEDADEDDGDEDEDEATDPAAS